MAPTMTLDCVMWIRWRAGDALDSPSPPLRTARPPRARPVLTARV